ncbi:EAL domain-containing protein [Aliivibrio fischeri]|nr:EAL domain-containing protein [Aliivibrio fischeri]KLU80434.1 hypothetical protein AB192_00990 [Aliivibrio fischeri]
MNKVIVFRFTESESLIKRFGIIRWTFFLEDILDRVKKKSELSLIQDDFGYDEFHVLVRGSSMPTYTFKNQIITCIANICDEVLGVLTRRLARIEVNMYDYFHYKEKKYYFFCNKMIAKEFLYSTSFGELKKIVDNKLITTYVQEIIKVPKYEVVGYEALSRGPANSSLFSAKNLFDEAKNQDIKYEFEFLCIINALALMNSMKDDTFLTINMSPLLLLDKTILAVLYGVKRLKIELTENTPITYWPPFLFVISRLQNEGIDVWLDDVESGFFDFETVNTVKPKVAKLCMSIVKRACSDVLYFCILRKAIKEMQNIGVEIVAEGIETAFQAELMRTIGVNYMQGYFFSKPRDALSAF